MDSKLNAYRSTDGAMPQGNVVFLSHRRVDKPVVRCVAALLSTLGVRHWLDEEDTDLAVAAQLGMLGDQALLHAIERGARHSTVILAVLSGRTMGSWWVPYEIGFARSAGKRAGYIRLGPDLQDSELPEYARVASSYQSVDEVVRWALTLVGHHLHADMSAESKAVASELSQYLPPQPPVPDLRALCVNACRAISFLATEATQRALELTSHSFAWMPTNGGAIRDIAYDLLAPLACFQLGLTSGSEVEHQLRRAYQAPTLHYRLAQAEPALAYDPECAGWKSARYQEPASRWMQGLSESQLGERLQRFVTCRTADGRLRLATLAEFKAEFDRVLQAGDESERRALGVLLNPVFGFAPQTRPVYWRVLAVQWGAFSRVAGRASDAGPFDERTRRAAASTAL